MLRTNLDRFGGKISFLGGKEDMLRTLSIRTPAKATCDKVFIACDLIVRANIDAAKWSSWCEVLGCDGPDTECPYLGIEQHS